MPFQSACRRARRVTCYHELPRITLLRTRVNKDKKEGRVAVLQPSSRPFRRYGTGPDCTPSDPVFDQQALLLVLPRRGLARRVLALGCLSLPLTLRLMALRVPGHISNLGESHSTKRHRKRQHQRRDQQRNALLHLLTSFLFSPKRKPAYLSVR